jgi:glycosyltransferase involved in cell wall biosynthesis
VINPPIDVERFHLSPEHDGYYLVLSRLVAYKRIDLAISACNTLKRRLFVIGDGPDRKRLETMAGNSVTFLGRLSDAEVEKYVCRCRALIFPGEEDFGMTPLEVAAAGKPTLAFAGGGALETIVPGLTGVVFARQDSQSVINGIEDLECRNWSSNALRKHATNFDRRVFRTQFQNLFRSMGIDAKLNAFPEPRDLPYQAAAAS